MTLKLYFAPGACSFVPHALLEEAGAPFEAVLVKLHKGENLTAEKTCYLLGDLDGFTWTNACQPNEGTALYGISLMARF